MDNRLTMPGTCRVLLLALPAAGVAVAAVLTLLPQERPHTVVRAPARAALRVLTGVPDQHPQGRPVRD